MEKWRLKETNKLASLDMWNSMARAFGEHKLPSFEDDSFLKLLEEYKMFDENSAVLDVGCGTGGYALALAGRCRKVVGVDLSPRMLELGRKKAADMGTSNIDFLCADWHEMDLDKSGFYKGFDLVFAHMTPAIQSADTFLKLSEAGCGWCAISKPTRRTDPVSDEVKRLVGITERRESSDRDMLFAFGLLWLQGLLPRFEYERQHWEMKKTPEEAYGLYVNRVKTYRDISHEEEQIIIKYLQSLSKDGLVCENVDTTITTMFWHV